MSSARFPPLTQALMQTPAGDYCSQRDAELHLCVRINSSRPRSFVIKSIRRESFDEVLEVFPSTQQGLSSRTGKWQSRFTPAATRLQNTHMSVTLFSKTVEEQRGRPHRHIPLIYTVNNKQLK